MGQLDTEALSLAGLTPGELAERYTSDRRSSDPERHFKAAEIAYALAVYWQDSDPRTAGKFARRCQCLMLRMERAQPDGVFDTDETTIGGVTMPSYLHSELVERRLGALLPLPGVPALGDTYHPL